MKILFLDSPAFAKKDMLEAFLNCNIETDLFMHEIIMSAKVLPMMRLLMLL